MWKMEKIILFGVLLSDACYLLSDACVFCRANCEIIYKL